MTKTKNLIIIVLAVALAASVYYVVRMKEDEKFSMAHWKELTASKAKAKYWIEWPQGRVSAYEIKKSGDCIKFLSVAGDIAEVCGTYVLTDLSDVQHEESMKIDIKPRN